MSPPTDRNEIGDLLRAGDPYRGEEMDPGRVRQIRALVRQTEARPRAFPRLAAAAALFGLLVGVVWNLPDADLPGEQVGIAAPTAPSETFPPHPSPELRLPSLVLTAAPVEWTPARAAPLPRPSSERLPRTIRFTAPGGTHIVWTLTSEVTLKGDDP